MTAKKFLGDIIARGLKFTGQADTLKVYGEGIWSPSLDSSGGMSGATFTSSGQYVRIGRLVFVRFAMNVTYRGTEGSGTLLINNLPFICSSSEAIVSSNIRYPGLQTPSGQSALMIVSPGVSRITLGTINGGDILWGHLPDPGTAALLGALTYTADQPA